MTKTITPEMAKLSAFLLLAIVVVVVQGHGRLRKPPGRGTAWREGFKTPPDYTDQGANCGGLGIQTANGGKCGLCGDNYKDKQPRAHEHGGKYGTGTIVGTFSAGQEVDTKIELTANHLGYMKFDICKLNGEQESEDCFEPVKVDGGDEVPVPKGKKNFDLKVKLPDGLSCEQCVLRWTYVGGNNWGGRDAAQETFVNCADITVT